jgi:hypothetical protein
MRGIYRKIRYHLPAVWSQAEKAPPSIGDYHCYFRHLHDCRRINDMGDDPSAEKQTFSVGETAVDDYSTNLSISATIATDKTQLDGAVAAGKKMTGVVGYEVPKDWEEIEIRFTPDFWSGNEIEFIANK